MGHPGAIEFSLERLDQLGSCLENICLYLLSVQSADGLTRKAIGQGLLQLLGWPEGTPNEGFRLLILGLLRRNPHLNHYSLLASLYKGADPFMRRGILLAAKANTATDWPREHQK